MTSGITPVSQPMDKFIGKTYHRIYRVQYDLHIMSDLESDKMFINASKSTVFTQWDYKSTG